MIKIRYEIHHRIYRNISYAYWYARYCITISFNTANTKKSSDYNNDNDNVHVFIWLFHNGLFVILRVSLFDWFTTMDVQIDVFPQQTTVYMIFV